MRSNSNKPQSMIVTRFEEAVMFALWGITYKGSVGTTIDRGVWRMIQPILLRSCPEYLAALPAAIQDEDSVEIDVDDQVLSMFSLTTCLERMSATPRVAAVAENWTRTPLGARTSWDQWVGYDKAIQAQILGVTSPTHVILDSEVPEWLPSLIAATLMPEIRSEGELLNWSLANTPLGISCVAWTDNDLTDPKACLSLSESNVSFAVADDPRLLRAKRAVQQLIEAREALADDPALADEVGWKVPGHEAIEIGATLISWRSRLDKAAKLKRTSGISLPDLWSHIRRDDFGDVAG
jgi:hypothetical protein